MTTTMSRLDRVISSQRRLLIFNVAMTVSIMAGFGASIAAMF